MTTQTIQQTTHQTTHETTHETTHGRTTTRSTTGPARRAVRPVLAVLALTGVLAAASLQGSTSAAAEATGAPGSPGRSSGAGAGEPVEGPAAGTATGTPGSSAAERAARAEGGGDVPWQGYEITETSRAASGWVGARRMKLGDGVATVYRVDPTRTRTSARFDEGHWVSQFRASDQGPLVSAEDTACAAQLLGRFGTTPDPLQLAGLDVAVYHLLYGRTYTVGGSDQIARADERENGPTIRAYGRKLISEYCSQSGPYTVTLTPSTTATDLGETIAYTASIKSRANVAMTDRLINVTVGTDEARAYTTNANGEFKFNAKPPASGPFKVSMVVRDLPYTRVRYFSGKSTGASRVVQAGLKMPESHPRESVVRVMGQPGIGGGAPDRDVTAERQFRVGFRMAKSYSFPRASIVRVYGPFSSVKAAEGACTSKDLLRSTRVPVRADGPYKTGALTVARRGIYVASVDVAADGSYNKPARLCGRPFQAR